MQSRRTMDAIEIEKIETTRDQRANGSSKGEKTNSDVKYEKSKSELLYNIEENPPWHLAVGLGFQQYLTMFGGTFTMPFILSIPLCFANEPVVISNILSTIMLASGIVTLLQATFGTRLPIIQGCTFAFLAPTFSSMALRGPCQPIRPTVPPTSYQNLTASTITFTSATTIATGEAEWLIRMREIQGAVMIAGLFQLVIGFSGVMGLLLRSIGPLTVIPTITLVALPLFETAYQYAGTQWGISMLTIFLTTLFSYVLGNIKLPFPLYSGGSWLSEKIPIFKLFPILCAVLLSWILCAILTATDVFPPGHKARTDTRSAVLHQVPWIRVPYPGQWGTPTLKVSTCIGMMAGVFSSVIESIGDYFACARIAGAPPLPNHAINRGLGIEGFGCILTGAFGTGNGTTSYSENVAALGITRVGSRRVIQFGALFMIILAIFSKFGALFVTVPDPVIGGIFIALFGLLTAVGLAPLQFVDLNSIRNLFVLGNSLFFGMVLPFWLKRNPGSIKTGSSNFDQVVTVVLSTNMAVGGLTGFILDNLLPGTLEERGLTKWKTAVSGDTSSEKGIASVHCYDIPFITSYLQRFRLTKYLPFVPYYGKDWVISNPNIPKP
ncbi:solute carrier family 23 member 2-like isoform X2 [Rhopilema esculentum]|uniref:solute carrier family 23 member 2-like isoform X2 n=1 Tax=Rhopilema esculentum TaxID=499914 RepID=UPI0031DD2E1E